MKADALLDLCKDALSAAGEPEVEIQATSRDRGIARFAMGELGQHMELTEPVVTVRVANGKRVAEGATTQLDPRSIAATIAETARAARLVPETEGFPGFAGAAADGPRPPRWSDATASADAERRVALLLPVLESIRAAGLVAAGVREPTRSSSAVATTRGCARAHDGTIASYKVWALETAGAGGAAGYGGHLHRDVASLRIDEETARAIRIAKLGAKPTSIDPGTYDVVFEPPAVCELLEWLGQIAFGAAEVEQGTSPMAGRIGEKITGEHVTIVEDPVDASDTGFGIPFDREGTWRRRVPLVENGVARAILRDRTYAARSGTTSTGSAVLPELGASASVAATALRLEGGTAASVDELVAGIDRGLYVCRLHYVNGLLEPRRAVMTGLTRDGCFLVERGKITRALSNMRFTDSFLEGLARADGMTRAVTAVPTWWSNLGASVAPAVRMRGFRFNGTSDRVAEG